jgi:Endonuclease/Exonuclease/phosphatase family
VPAVGDVKEREVLALERHKTHSTRGILRFGRRPVLIALAAAVLALPIPAAAGADTSSAQGGPKVTVMTRNIFLGADLGPVLAATSIDGAIDAAGVVWNELESTNFPERAVPLAKEIKQSKADLVGLQEVALWRQQIPSDLGAPPTGFGTPATDVKYDFLALLLQELGGKYRVVRVQEEFDAELPVDLDGSNATGGAFGAELDGRLTMRDVILARKGTNVKNGGTDAGHYTQLFVPRIAGILPLPVKRGWVSVEAQVSGNNKRQFRFVNTHLEAFGEDTIREAQAKELFAPGGPLDTTKQVILVGDINSGTAERHNIHGTDQLAFRALLDFGMKDNGAIQSCCYSDLFDPTQVFDHTVDHVLTKPGLRTREAFVTGNDPSERTPSGLWPSDHGGVVSTLLFGK